MDAAKVKSALADITAHEVRRLANLPECRNPSEREKLVNEVADELKVKSLLHSD
jgi:hypothetical protein